MGRTDNWGEEPLKRAKHLIRFLASYNNSQKSSLFVKWQDENDNENSDRPELNTRTTLLDLARLLYPEGIKSNHDPKAKAESEKIRNTINRLKNWELSKKMTATQVKVKAYGASLSFFGTKAV